jgi:hypothetical protein
MKIYTMLFTTLVSIFSFHCFGQENYVIASAETRKTPLKFDNKSSEDLVVESYYVEEVINMPFGKRTTKYEVSKLDMVNTYDLGPNNTRIVTPKYKKTKVKESEISIQSKDLADSTEVAIKPIKVEVTASAAATKYANVDIVSTYAKVLDKGDESADMLKKVADKAYFDGEWVLAVKYYSQLFNINADLEAVYYYRYAQSLKATNQTEKGNEMMQLFEEKNL